MEATNVTLYTMERDGDRNGEKIVIASWDALPLVYVAASSLLLLLLLLMRVTLLRCYKGQGWLKVLGLSVAVCGLVIAGGYIHHRRDVNVSISSALSFSAAKAGRLCKLRICYFLREPAFERSLFIHSDSQENCSVKIVTVTYDPSWNQPRKTLLSVAGTTPRPKEKQYLFQVPNFEGDLLSVLTGGKARSEIASVTEIRENPYGYPAAIISPRNLAEGGPLGISNPQTAGSISCVSLLLYVALGAGGVLAVAGFFALCAVCERYC